MGLLQKIKIATKRFAKDNKFEEFKKAIEEHNQKVLDRKKARKVKPKVESNKQSKSKVEQLAEIIYPENGYLPFGCQTTSVKSLIESIIEEKIPVNKVKKNYDDDDDDSDDSDNFSFDFEPYVLLYDFVNKKLVMTLIDIDNDILYFIDKNHKILYWDAVTMWWNEDNDYINGNYYHEIYRDDDKHKIPFRPATDAEIEKFVKEFTA